MRLVVQELQIGGTSPPNSAASTRENRYDRCDHSPAPSPAPTVGGSMPGSCDHPGLGVAGPGARPRWHRRRCRESDRCGGQHLDLADRRGQGRSGGEGRGAMPQLPPGSPFEEFFDDFFKNRRGGGGPRSGGDMQPHKTNSLGSGFIIDPVRHRRDQQSRHCGCGRDQRHSERRHQDQGRTRRRRQEDRPCGVEIQAVAATDGGEVRRFRQAASRRMGDRDRQSRSASAAR